jgi:hypothetical protein
MPFSDKTIYFGNSHLIDSMETSLSAIMIKCVSKGTYLGLDRSVAVMCGLRYRCGMAAVSFQRRLFSPPQVSGDGKARSFASNVPLELGTQYNYRTYSV